MLDTTTKRTRVQIQIIFFRNFSVLKTKKFAFFPLNFNEDYNIMLTVWIAFDQSTENELV